MGYMLVPDKSTGQLTLVNGTASNLIYRFVLKVAGYDLYIHVIIKNNISRGFSIQYV